MKAIDDDDIIIWEVGSILCISAMTQRCIGKHFEANTVHAHCFWENTAAKLYKRWKMGLPKGDESAQYNSIEEKQNQEVYSNSIN